MNADSKNKVVINSGRNHQILDKWFKGLDLDFAAEHGMFIKKITNGIKTYQKRSFGMKKS